MKKLLVILSVVLTQVSFASITNSQHEVRHLELLESSIKENCGKFNKLTQTDSKKKIIMIDQGIRDVQFTTILTGIHRLDQGIFDKYEILVESQYADMFDHTSQKWGVYTVSSVTCSMK